VPLKIVITTLKNLFKAYHYLISPWLGNRCRFTPTCSDYAQQALDTHGLGKGLWLSGKRICRCHPWGGEGHDPVPKKPGEKPTENLQSSTLNNQINQNALNSD